MNYKTINDLGDLHNKVVMLRADLNVPMDENFNVTNTARIDRTVPTIKELMSKGAKVVVISHFGRPEGKGDMKNSLSHIVSDLEKALGKKVVFVEDCIGEKVEQAVKSMSSDEVLLLENVRYEKGETKNDEELSKKFYEVSAKIYQQANPEGAADPNMGAAPGSDAGSADDNVVDTDYEVVD